MRKAKGEKRDILARHVIFKSFSFCDVSIHLLPAGSWCLGFFFLIYCGVALTLLLLYLLISFLPLSVFGHYFMFIIIMWYVYCVLFGILWCPSIAGIHSWKLCETKPTNGRNVRDFALCHI